MERSLRGYSCVPCLRKTYCVVICTNLNGGSNTTEATSLGVVCESWSKTLCRGIQADRQRLPSQVHKETGSQDIFANPATTQIPRAIFLRTGAPGHAAKYSNAAPSPKRTNGSNRQKVEQIASHVPTREVADGPLGGAPSTGNFPSEVAATSPA